MTGRELFIPLVVGTVVLRFTAAGVAFSLRETTPHLICICPSHDFVDMVADHNSHLLSDASHP